MEGARGSKHERPGMEELPRRLGRLGGCWRKETGLKFGVWNPRTNHARSNGPTTDEAKSIEPIPMKSTIDASLHEIFSRLSRFGGIRRTDYHLHDVGCVLDDLERGTEHAENFTHGDHVQHVVVEDGDQSIGIAMTHEIVVEAGHLVARHVARSPAPAYVCLERLQTAVAEGSLPAATRGMEEIEMTRRQAHPHAVHVRTSEQERARRTTCR